MKGEWTKLFRASEIFNEQAAIARKTARRRRRGDDLESRVIRADNLVHVGELSSARQCGTVPRLSVGLTWRI